MIFRLVKIIYSMFGYDANKIKHLSKTEPNLIFESKRWIYLIIKNISYFLVFFCAITFFVIYGLMNSNPDLAIPVFFENKVIISAHYAPLKDTFAPFSYIWLIFGILYLVFSIKVFKEYMSAHQHPNKNTKENILSFFDATYWSCIIVIMIVRISLYFSIDGIQYTMDPANFSIMAQVNGSNDTWIAFVALYYIVTILTISLMILPLIMFVHHPKLKPEYKNQIKLAINQIKTNNQSY